MDQRKHRWTTETSSPFDLFVLLTLAVSLMSPALGFSSMASSSFRSRTLRLARITSPIRGVGGGGASSTRVHRPLASAAAGKLLPAALRPSPSSVPARLFATTTQPVTSSLRDSSPNWNNRPPREKILHDDSGFTSDDSGFTSDGDIARLDDGCDFEHWLVVVEPPPGDPKDPDVPREEIIDSYIKTLSKVVGSEEKARQKIYSVSTRHYFAFGALVSEEISYKIKELPNVRWVLPDSYLDVKNKNYGGEPFINGESVPYDPKYHEHWVRNYAPSICIPCRDRLRSSRNVERREIRQKFQNRDAPLGQGQIQHLPSCAEPSALDAPWLGNTYAAASSTTKR